jgi:hypothetical protein
MKHNKLGATGLLPMAIALLWLHCSSVVSAQTDTAVSSAFVTHPTGASVLDAVLIARHHELRARV